MFTYKVEILLDEHAAQNMIWILIHRILNLNQLLRAYCLELENKYYSSVGCCSHTSERWKDLNWKKLEIIPANIFPICVKCK